MILLMRCDMDSHPHPHMHQQPPALRRRWHALPTQSGRRSQFPFVLTLLILTFIITLSNSSFLTSTLAADFPTSVAAVTSSSSLIVTNTTILLSAAVSAPYVFVTLLPTGWNRLSLCTFNRSGNTSSQLNDCSLRVTLTLISPTGGNVACDIQTVVQSTCTSQTSPLLSPQQQVCVSIGEDGVSVAFPQDSVNHAFQTLFSSSQNQNSVQLGLSPSRFLTSEAVAKRNKQAYNPPSIFIPNIISSYSISGNTTITTSNGSVIIQPQNPSFMNYSRMINATQSDTIGVQLLLLPNVPCGVDVTMNVLVEVVHGSDCATVAVEAKSEDSDLSTAVPCGSPHGTCMTDGGSSGTSIVCTCDAGYTGSDCSIDSGASLIFPSHVNLSSFEASRPHDDPTANLSAADASMFWTNPTNWGVKGEILLLQNVTIGETIGETKLQNVPQGLEQTTSRHHSISSSADSSAYYYYFSSLNYTSLLSSYSLLFHITIPSPQTLSSPITLQFSPKAYPTLNLQLPVSCWNLSDLEAWSQQNIMTQAKHKTGEMKIGDGSSSITSCITFNQTFPMPYSGSQNPVTAQTMKLMIHADVLKAMLRADGGSETNESDWKLLYFSLASTTQTMIDLRVWWQSDLHMFVPQHEESSHTDVTPSIPWPTQSWTHTLTENDHVYFTLNATASSSFESQPQSSSTADQLSTLYVMINDTTCVSGGLTSGYYAPHWYYTSNSTDATNLGNSPSGLPVMFTPSSSLPPGQVMNLAGGCIRPNQRLISPSTPNVAAGWFGELYAICETVIQLSVWHISPIELSMNSMNTFVPAVLNSTGQGCWREFYVDITTSVQNDLFIIVDQPDANILMRLGEFPTLENQYNSTAQLNIPAGDQPTDDDYTIKSPRSSSSDPLPEPAAPPSEWTQHSILYADVSHGSRWYISVYLDPSLGTMSQPFAPRQFQIKLVWRTNSSFSHISKTLIAIFAVSGSVVALLVIIALKMRWDAWRRKQKRGGGGAAKNRNMNQNKASTSTVISSNAIAASIAQTERARLMSGARQSSSSDYMNMNHA